LFKVRENEKTTTETHIHKVWNNPMELLSLQFVFHELKEVKKGKNSICLSLVNTKTRFEVDLKLFSTIIKQTILPALKCRVSPPDKTKDN